MKKKVGTVFGVIAAILLVIAGFRFFITGFYADEYWLLIVLIVGLIFAFIAGKLGFGKEKDNEN